MLIVSYYTKDTPYADVMEDNLLPTLKYHDLEYYVEAVPDLGGWHKNTEYKATFIKKCLLKFKRDIVFTDADSQILKIPTLFEEIPEEYDIAVHWLDWYKMWRNQEGNEKRELLSGTMMFRYNKRTLNLCDEYIRQCKKETGKKLEQKILEDILRSTNDKILKIYELPPKYCAIVKHDGKLPDYMKDPVICHFQASRDHKNKKLDK